jgi:2-desacetyl-2-hydroxyethyl bacteriochlorophyllide A dehydrogenase
VNVKLEAEAYWAVAPGRGEIRPVTLAPPGADDVLVETRWSAISRGTEALVAAGRVPASQAQAMRCPFQEGSFPFPVKYGYCSVGTVVDGHASLRGRSVFCLHPHQTRYVVPASSVHVLPDGLPAASAVLAANMETALNAVWDARPGPGDRIVVVGAGVVGLLVAHLCDQLPGTETLAYDVDAGRAAVASELGLAFTNEAPVGADADLVVHASGHEAGLRTALAAAGTEATVLELSWYGDRSVTLPLGEAFHSRRLTLKSSQVGRICPERAPRWDRGRRLRKALALLQDARLDALISGESAFEDLPRTLAKLSADPAGALCHRIRYR